jgi:hypothetical protein
MTLVTSVNTGEPPLLRAPSAGATQVDNETLWSLLIHSSLYLQSLIIPAFPSWISAPSAGYCYPLRAITY